MRSIMEELYMNETNFNQDTLTLPLVALKDVVIYPKMTVSIDVGRAESAAAVRQAMKVDRYLVAVMQKNPKDEVPNAEDLF